MRPIAITRQFAPSVRIEELAPNRDRATQRPRSAMTPAASLVDLSLDEAADLYYPRRDRGLGYKHFESARAAVRYVRDSLTPQQRVGSVIQVGERRLESNDVALLVERARAVGVEAKPAVSRL